MLVREYLVINESETYIDEVLRQFIKAINLCRVDYEINKAEYIGDIIYVDMSIGQKDVEIQLTNDAIGWSAYIDNTIYLGELTDWLYPEFKETLLNYVNS